MSSYLEMYLGPLLPQLARVDVTDIFINRPGEMWIETLGGGAERHAVPELNDELLSRLARQIANITHQGISREHPLLASSLPDGARVQVIAPPATRGPMAIAVRKHVMSDLAIPDYEAVGAFDDTRNSKDAADGDDLLVGLYERRQWGRFLCEAVRRRKTILVSGGTSTGKTTFINALMKEVPSEERLILIEDTPELIVSHANSLGLVCVRGELGETRVSADDLLIASLRMRPDRIILGELRGSEAYTFLRAINTGHPGSMSTIHADSPGGALEQISLLVLKTYPGMRRQDVLDYCAQLVEIVVQLDRKAGVRKVTEVAWRRSLTRIRASE